jgi:hypothetical protein
MFWTTTSAATAEEARSRGDGQRASRAETRRAPNASSAAASLGWETQPNPPVSCRRSPMISLASKPPGAPPRLLVACLRPWPRHCFPFPKGVTGPKR